MDPRQFLEQKMQELIVKNEKKDIDLIMRIYTILSKTRLEQKQADNLDKLDEMSDAMLLEMLEKDK